MANMSVSSYQNINISSVNTFGDMLKLFNTSGAGYLFAGINIMLFFIFFITFATSFGWEVALLSAAFISFVIGLLFVYMGVMAWWILGVWLGLIIIGIMYKAWKST
jgi:hypothetical protein